MKYLFKFLGKYLIWVIAAVFGFFAVQTYYCKGQENEKLQTYNRQLEGKLTDAEQALQAANNELGISKSQLLSKTELTDVLKDENEKINQEFEEFKRKHNLVIKSKDRAIARLEQEIRDGKSDTDVIPVDTDDTELCLELREKCVVAYGWHDNLDRFSLIDPNIFIPNNEVFTSRQLFKIRGEIYEQEDGSLQTRRLTIHEVYEYDGIYKEVPNGKAEIVEHEFVYSNPPSIDPEEWSPLDLFKLRMIASIGIEMVPEPGDMRFGLGLQWLEWNGIGINNSVSFDFDDPENIALYIGASWVPTFDDFQMNLGIGASVGTPFYNMFNEASFKVDLIFYVW